MDINWTTLRIILKLYNKLYKNIKVRDGRQYFFLNAHLYCRFQINFWSSRKIHKVMMIWSTRKVQLWDGICGDSTFNKRSKHFAFYSLSFLSLSRTL